MLSDNGKHATDSLGKKAEEPHIMKKAIIVLVLAVILIGGGLGVAAALGVFTSKEAFYGDWKVISLSRDGNDYADTLNALEASGRYFYMTFEEDGTYKMDNGGRIQTGTWQHEGGNKVSVTLTGAKKTKTAIARLQGAELVFEQSAAKIICERWPDKPDDVNSGITSQTTEDSNATEASQLPAAEDAAEAETNTQAPAEAESTPEQEAVPETPDGTEDQPAAPAEQAGQATDVQPAAEQPAAEQVAEGQPDAAPPAEQSEEPAPEQPQQ